MKAPLLPNEAQRLETLRGYDVLDTPPESTFDDLTLLAAQICQVPIALISLVDENRQWFKSTIGVSATETSRDFAFCAHAILYSDEVLEVRDAQLDPRFADNPLVTADPHIRFYAGAPLVTPDGLALGTLCVIDRVPRVLSAEQQTALRALSRTVIVQLELRRTLAAHRRAEEQLQSLNASLEQKVEARTADLRISATAFESHESMMITDANSVILRVNQAFTESTGYTAEEAVGQTPRLLKSGRHNAGFYRAMWKTINRTGTWQGEIWDRRKNGVIYPKWLTITAVKGDDGVVTHYVGSHSDITERKAAEEKIQYLAFYDLLTGLPNRQLLLDRFQQTFASSARSGREGAVLLIDLDNFKDINDTLGHDIGDSLLQQTAQRLKSCVREGDTVARLVGDEFVVVLENLSEQPIEAATQTEAISEKILAALSKPYHLAKYEYQGTASIGATLINGHQQTAEELLKQADIAMYQAKKAGRNTLRFFDPQMQASITGRFSLEGELHKALEKQQFQLYYQIQVDSSYRPLGAEALIRWIHPERGMVSPAQFIPLAEKTGLILPIGQWVLETACAQIKMWEKAALTHDLFLAVNVSAKQFHQADFVAQVQAAMQHHAINPMRLKLELTEGMLLENIEDTIATMNALNEIGVKFSLDDFGTGYSSLQYLKRLPLDQLKIDQTFVRDLAADSSDKAIVRTIIAMAHSLDLNVIAEGVETEEQRQLLMERGCTHYQGYLFSKPVPIAQFEASLKQG
jgi:diguanylate cyclase (GGDEF)-like protein/PAS domain S-box-containing protein